MKKHSNIYPLIFGLIFVLVGILTYFTNGSVTVGFIVLGLFFIGISVSLFISDKKKKATVAQNQPTVTPDEIKPQNNKQNIKNNVSAPANSIDLDAAIKASRGNNAILNTMIDMIIADCQRYSVPENRIQALCSEYLNQCLKCGGAEEFVFSYDAISNEYTVSFVERGKAKRIFGSKNPLDFRFLFQLHIVHQLEDDINDDSQSKKVRCEDVMQKLNPEFGETEEYKKTINRFKSTWSDFQTETKPFVRIAEGYDGGFREYYLDLCYENSKFVIRKTAYDYYAGREKLLKEIHVPDSINTQEKIFKFIVENSSSFRFCKVTIDDLLNNKALIGFIQTNKSAKADLYDNRTIYKCGTHIPGALYEEVKLRCQNGVYYYITTSMTDRMNAGGHKVPVPPMFINNDNDIDIDGLLVYIAQHHMYMETMIKYLCNKKESKSTKETIKTIAKIDGLDSWVKSVDGIKKLLFYLEKTVYVAEKYGYVVKSVRVSGGVHEIVFSNKVYSSFTETKEKLSVDFTECNADVESVLVELSRNGFPFFILFQCGEIFAPDKPRVTEALCDVFKDSAVPLELENQEQLESGQKN